MLADVGEVLGEPGKRNVLVREGGPLDYWVSSPRRGRVEIETNDRYRMISSSNDCLEYPLEDALMRVKRVVFCGGRDEDERLELMTKSRKKTKPCTTKRNFAKR